MLKKIFYAAEVLLFLAVAIAAVAVLVIIFPDGGDTPAWVQAVGSIAAIIAAFLIPTYQHRQVEKGRKAESAQRDVTLVHICYIMAMEACSGLSDVTSKFEERLDEFRSPVGEERLEELRRSLQILAAKDLPSEIYFEILLIQREVVYSLTAVREVNASLGVSVNRIEKSHKRLRRAVFSRNRLRQKWREYQLAADSLLV